MTTRLVDIERYCFGVARYSLVEFKEVYGTLRYKGKSGIGQLIQMTVAEFLNDEYSLFSQSLVQQAGRFQHDLTCFNHMLNYGFAMAKSTRSSTSTFGTSATAGAA